MSDITSNRTGEYLKAHAEVEREDNAGSNPALVGEQGKPAAVGGTEVLHASSPLRLFNQHWQAAVALMAARGEREPSHQFKTIAETFFLWGWYDGRLTP